MDHHALLLLGLLRTQSQHGYQINEFIENALGTLTTLKKPTAYALLDRLYKEHLVDVRGEQEGNRPPRKVFLITPAGEARFLALLRETLASAEPPVAASDVALMFLDALEPSERLECLEQRLGRVSEHIRTLEAVPPHQNVISVNLALERQLVLLRADRAWLEGLIAQSDRVVQRTSAASRGA